MRTRPAGALLVATMLLAGCSLADDGGRDHDPANRPGYLLSGNADNAGRDRQGADRGHVATGDAGALQEATFVMLQGADVVRVRTADLGGGLYRVSTPDDSKVAPAVQVDNGTVLAALVGTGSAGPAVVTAELSSAVRWRVRLEGGAGEQDVDLSGGRVDTVELTTGTNRAEVTLPPAAGTLRVAMTGGAGQLVVHLSGPAPARVRVGSGAGTVSLEGTSHLGVAGGTVYTSDGWDAATDRYDVDAVAGLSMLAVDRR